MSRRELPAESLPPAQSRAEAAQTAPDRRWFWLIGTIIVAGLLSGVLLVIRDRSGELEVAQVRSFEVLTRNHVDGPVSYPQSPPIGGDHAPVWMNCGTYEAPVTTEMAVHSMEHGAIWITYSKDLPIDQVTALQQLGRTQPYVVVSPFNGLNSAVVLSAWGKQLALSSTEDERFNDFLDAYRQGPQTPEPGAICTNGTGTPS